MGQEPRLQRWGARCDGRRQCRVAVGLLFVVVQHERRRKLLGAHLDRSGGTRAGREVSLSGGRWAVGDVWCCAAGVRRWCPRARTQAPRRRGVLRHRLHPDFTCLLEQCCSGTVHVRGGRAAFGTRAGVGVGVGGVRGRRRTRGVVLGGCAGPSHAGVAWLSRELCLRAAACYCVLGAAEWRAFCGDRSVWARARGLLAPTLPSIDAGTGAVVVPEQVAVVHPPCQAHCFPCLLPVGVCYFSHKARGQKDCNGCVTKMLKHAYVVGYDLLPRAFSRRTLRAELRGRAG